MINIANFSYYNINNFLSTSPPSLLLLAKNAESIRDRNAQQAKAQYQLPDGSFIEVLQHHVLQHNMKHYHTTGH